MNALVPPARAESSELVEARRRAWLRGWVFRIGFVYWMVYCTKLIFGELGTPVFTWPLEGLTWVFNRLDVWVGHHMLGIRGPINTVVGGSGDRAVDWLQIPVMLGIATIVATVWSAIDRRRACDVRLRALLLVALRYALGFNVLSYGMDKLLVMQFPPPNDIQLFQRWGDSSPMNVLWTFMGASPAYEVFTGAMEVLGAALVLFRRTATLGALLLTAVFVNVVVLNFCYDVCVKLHSSHLLVMCILVWRPEAGRLFDVLVRHRAVSVPLPPPVLSRRWRITRRVGKYGLIALLLFSTEQWTTKVFAIRRAPRMADHWAVGSWNVTSLVRNGREVPVGDATRWQRVTFQAYGDDLYLRWRIDDTRSALYTAKFDEAAHILQLAIDDDSDHPTGAPRSISLHYVHEPSDATHLALTGQLDADILHVELGHQDASHMLLRTRGFHWINEEPFNR